MTDQSGTPSRSFEDVYAVQTARIRALELEAAGLRERLAKAQKIIDIDYQLMQLGVTDAWRIENIKETAIARFNVKGSRKQHIKRILDDAFNQLFALTHPKGEDHGNG